ncbi:MAG: ribonucleoside-diphosphate reductase subunit alpha [Myxococcales bacterium]|nr:ribonucleoside-diphosphate reductase subunit alpha [Myxococcales bacterium]
MSAAEPVAEIRLVLDTDETSSSTEMLTLSALIAEVAKLSTGLQEVSPPRIAQRVFQGLHDGLPRGELDKLLVKTAATLVIEEPEYAYLAARLLLAPLYRDLRCRGIESFTDSIETAYTCGLVSTSVRRFILSHREELDAAIVSQRDELFRYFGLQTVLDRYLLRHPDTRKPLEAPQHFLLRVACGLAKNVDEAIELYGLMSRLEYLPSSPTLFNSGTPHSQMSSCYLLDSPSDDLESIYGRYTDVAKLSKYAGGIGLAYHRIRSQGSLIRGTNGLSRGIVPWLKTLDASVAAVNQGGRRKGACCVYLETWHADILEFLELRENTGDEARRTHNLNLANWVPDLFMKRVESGEQWSFFDPKKVPQLSDLYGEAFERAYEEAERRDLFEKQVPARDLYQKMMRTLAQTGNGWMTFKDACNLKSNQTGEEGVVVHSSNLCTEIVEVTSQDETAVCNLGSVNLGKFIKNKTIDYDRLRQTVQTAVKFLDRVIDINYYPTEAAAASNRRWRPVGLGVMGFQDVLFELGLPFLEPQAIKIARKIQQEIYFAAVDTSCRLAELYGPHETFHQTRAAKGKFQFDLWPGVKPTSDNEDGQQRWEALRKRMVRYGLRNSLLIAIAPTATIASIAGCFECIEPQVSNLFKRETMSGEFLQINHFLVRDLKNRGLWTDEIRRAIMAAEGSVQGIEGIPPQLQDLYRTAWELPQRALIDLAAERSPFIDQSQSLNLFMETPTIGKLSSMYMYAWKRGLKTTYYLRSRPATRIQQTVRGQASASSQKTFSEAEKLACSLENPESCDACQ